MKTFVLEHQAIEIFVECVLHGSGSVRLNAIWAVKNLLCMAPRSIKEKVMHLLGWDNLFGLLRDSDVTIQEQAANIIRNLVYTKDVEEMEEVFQSVGSALFELLTTTFCESPSDEVLVQCVYILSNMCTGTEQQKQVIIDHQELIRALLTHLRHQNPLVRTAVLWAMANVLWYEESPLEHSRVGERAIELLRYDIMETIGELAHDPDMDVRDRARTVQEYLERASELSIDSMDTS